MPDPVREVAAEFRAATRDVRFAASRGTSRRPCAPSPRARWSPSAYGHERAHENERWRAVRGRIALHEHAAKARRVLRDDVGRERGDEVDGLGIGGQRADRGRALASNRRDPTGDGDHLAARRVRVARCTTRAMEGMSSRVDSPPILKASATLPTTRGSSVVPSLPPFAAATTIGAYAMPLSVSRSRASARRPEQAVDGRAVARASLERALGGQRPRFVSCAAPGSSRRTGRAAPPCRPCSWRPPRRRAGSPPCAPYQASGPTSTRPVEPSARSYPRSIQPRSRSTPPSCRPSRFAYSARTEALPPVREERAHLERRRRNPHLGVRVEDRHPEDVGGPGRNGGVLRDERRRRARVLRRDVDLRAEAHAPVRPHASPASARPWPTRHPRGAPRSRCRRESSRRCSPTGRSSPPDPRCVALSPSSSRSPKSSVESARARSPRSTISPSPCIDPGAQLDVGVQLRPAPTVLDGEAFGQREPARAVHRGGPGRRAGGRSRRAHRRRTGRA